MLYLTSELIGSQVEAIDGKVGRVNDLLFDDRAWRIRYLVIEAGEWPHNPYVLISPRAVTEPEWGHRRVGLNSTREKVMNSPPLDTHKPVSRQYESLYHDYYGWMPYWELGYEGVGFAPIIQVKRLEESRKKPKSTGDPHLRSAKVVLRYSVSGRGGQAGVVEDILIEEADWSLRYFVVDTQPWWPGGKVILSPEWVSTISWRTSLLGIRLSRRKLRHAPRYDPHRPLTRDYQEQLHDYYGKPHYWRPMTRVNI